jgi:hypothetical protein
MTILFDPARRFTPSRPFGLGLADEPAPPDAGDDDRPEPEPTEADRAWWAEYLDGAGDDDMEQRAHESYATEALSLGLIPRDLAEALMASSLIGHDA